MNPIFWDKPYLDSISAQIWTIPQAKTTSTSHFWDDSWTFCWFHTRNGPLLLAPKLAFQSIDWCHYCFLSIHDFTFLASGGSNKTFVWLVVATPLKNIRQLGWLFPIYRKIKNIPNHQPVVVVTGVFHCISKVFLRCSHQRFPSIYPNPVLRIMAVVFRVFPWGHFIKLIQNIHPEHLDQ